MFPALVALLTVELAAQTQRKVQIGYVYPASGQQGSTFEVVIATRSLTGINGVHVSGGNVHAEIVGLRKLMTLTELYDARR